MPVCVHAMLLQLVQLCAPLWTVLSFKNLTGLTGSTNPVLCDNQGGGVGWKVEGGSRGGETYICLWLIHIDIWQKLTQYCKAIILQLKVNKIF